MTMTRKGPSTSVAPFLVIALIISSQLAPTAEAACNATQLAPCLPALMPPYPQPTDDCCARLREQEPCLCEYMKDPEYGKYVKSPEAAQILEYCKVPYPKCD